MRRNDSGIKSATGLTGSGSRDWVMQRISAVVLAIYAVVMVGFFLINGDVSYQQWVSFIMSLPMRLLSLVAIIALAAHAWVGMWTVFTDYVKSTGLRLVLQAAMIIAILVYLFWGVMIFWGPGLLNLG
ncbi:succinate dehydrogenase, hydrophobic membrane anchor protein [Psychrobacter sp. YP14]|uniref:Succinate dehydrogenase hydrophobic membrane anchor subunit n=3 Tax=Psychrobacter TaxID=497 RepID=A0A844LYC3_9GAMM|nr:MULTISPECIES: succinate dehydrogenase, hydrophobic membrane anchor protein [Psychrobacter]AWT48299.1 succinate dehydrogenase, hydrophobic membrane anchor protein [Psychrobacter sp. YP14]MUG31565.1 succinate dehydrogenase, hydrophobic membrane anchor protein [Psychrobacter sanguinis]UNK05637.1 succinate dehydrogenase, hydrophobic membrane anchor protein [Psychrobacter sp. PraFG1]